MNRGQIRDELSFLLNFNAAAADQAFTTARLNTAIQTAYERVVRRIIQEGQEQWFKKYTDVTWSADAVTLALPATVSQKGLLYIRDITDDDIGTDVSISRRGASTIFWVDNATLQWGLTGPSSDRTLRFFYDAVAETLSSDSSTPALIPAEYHELIVWTAGTILRQVADETAPPAWISERDQMMLDLVKFVSKPRPESAHGLGANLVDDSYALPAQDGSSITV